jgi:hypothetical protein
MALLPCGRRGEEEGGEGPQGPLAAPGKYTVTLAKQVNGVVTPVGQPQPLEAVPVGMSDLSAQDQAAQLTFQRRPPGCSGLCWGAAEAVEEARTRIQLIQKAILQTPKADLKLAEQARNLDLHLQAIQVKLTGDPVLAANQEPTPRGLTPVSLRTMSGDLLATCSVPGVSRRWLISFRVSPVPLPEPRP